VYFFLTTRTHQIIKKFNCEVNSSCAFHQLKRFQHAYVFIRTTAEARSNFTAFFSTSKVEDLIETNFQCTHITIKLLCADRTPSALRRRRLLLLVGGGESFAHTPKSCEGRALFSPNACIS